MDQKPKDPFLPPSPSVVSPIAQVSKKTKLEVPADLYFSASIRNLAKDIFQLVGFSTEWQNRLKLVVDELYMNSVKYGSDDKSMIKIEFEALENGVRFEISDEGRGSHPITAEKLKAKIQNQKETMDVTKTSGRGLAMFTEQWSDKYDIISNHHGGITVIFIKYLNQF
jgi:anti-sigma regulatory factor (Ser/Thr protein kinase)